MKKLFALLLCVVVLSALCLASCNNSCEHTFSDEWYSDETNHWHPATCEHAETERGDFGPHVDADEDSLCDVCASAVGHQHTFEDVWQSDDTHHWKNATCSHSDEKGEYENHSDKDGNGVCEICKSHVHKVNAVGYCEHDDCGKKVKDIDETKLEELVPAVFFQKFLVNGGNINYSFTGRSNTSSIYEATREEIVSYVFGKDNYTHTDVSTTTVSSGVKRQGALKTWHQFTGGEDVFGVVKEDDNPLALDFAEAGRLNGYYIALSTLAGDYGVEATLYALYEAAISETTTDLVVKQDEVENMVTFAYDYKTVFINETEIAVGDNVGSKVYNVNYYEVEVTFTYTDDYALTSLVIVVDAYTNDPGTSQGDGFLYDDVDLQYNPDTQTYTFVKYDHDKGEFVPLADGEMPTPDTYVIRVTQTVGDRTEENPYPMEKFVPEDFDLYLTHNENGTLDDKLTGDLIVNVGDVINLYAGNYTPDGTSLHFVSSYVTMKMYKDGVEIEEFDNLLENPNPIVVAAFTFSGSQRSFFIIPKQDGTYKFEIYLAGKLMHSVNIHAGIVNAEDIVTKDNEFAVVVTEAYEWSNEVTFTATESGTYYFNLPAGVGMIDADAYDIAELTPETDDTPVPYFDYNNAKGENGGYIAGSFRLELEAGQSVRFYVNAVKKGPVIISFFCI